MWIVRAECANDLQQLTDFSESKHKGSSMSLHVLRWVGSRSRLALTAGVVGAVALALGTTASLGGFTASITNTGDKVATGSLLMQEQVTPSGGTTTTCLSTATGAAITTNANAACVANKFGALTNAIPGATSFSTVIIANQGSVTASSFTMGTGACASTPTAPAGAAATNVGSDLTFCNKVDVTIEDDTGTATCVYPVAVGVCPAASNTNNLATLSTAYTTIPLALTGTVAAGASRTYKFAVTIDNSATNADQAMAATEPITFNFGA
jgi:hypothetical protein